MKLGFKKSEVGTLIKYIFGKQIEGTEEKSLADSLTTELTATMIVLKQEWENIRKKGSTFFNISKIIICTKLKLHVCLSKCNGWA